MQHVVERIQGPWVVWWLQASPCRWRRTFVQGDSDLVRNAVCLLHGCWMMGDGSCLKAMQDFSDGVDRFSFVFFSHCRNRVRHGRDASREETT